MSEKFDLMTTVEYGGCSAKLPAAELEKLLSDIPILNDANLLVGNDTHDDAMVWKLDEKTALISTTDFFPPVCSDAYEFGQIAAANALSDIYAMGGKTVSALNLVLFPSDKRIPMKVLHEILMGGAEKCIEAGAVLSGGHTIDDFPPKYGLAVTGIVHPDRIITNATAMPGEVLILTKALGTGVLSAGRRIGEADYADYQAALDSMKQLNRYASEIMQEYNLRCATDITGFSLLGHGMKLARESNVCLEIDSRSIPVLPGVYDLIDYGCIPGASFRNLAYVESYAEFGKDLDYNLKMVAVDAQTSGGILMCVPENDASAVHEELRDKYRSAAIIGKIREHETDGPFIRFY